MVKKYKDKDIAVVTKNIAPKQKERLQKYCRVYIHTNQKIECKVIITNWDTSIIDFVNKEAKCYTVLHTDYANPTEKLGLPKDNSRITYIGITEVSMKNFMEITGIKDRVILCRNPLELEEDKPILKIMSATRLSDIKDGGRCNAIANELERQGIDYIWYFFTSNEYKTNSIWGHENVIHLKSRLDVGRFMKEADWLVQPSICEGDSYSLKESLYRGTPIVVCELPYFKEIGIINNENALFLEKDLSNIKDVVKAMKKPLKFKFEPIKDNYDEIMVDGKSRYEEEKKMKVKVRCIMPKGYTDLELKRHIDFEEEFEVELIRAQYLEENGAVQILPDTEKVEVKEPTRLLEISEIKPVPVEKAKEIVKKSRGRKKKSEE